MPLTVNSVKNAKVGRHSDGGGLYLLVKPQLISEGEDKGKPKLGPDGKPLVASKSWVLRVQHNGKRQDFGLGGFTPDAISADIPLHRKKLLTLAEAREKARTGRVLAKAGLNPSEEWRKADGGGDAEARPFRTIADERYKQIKSGWKNDRHTDEWLGSLERYAFPIIGDMEVEDVDASAIQRVLLPIWLTKSETARRIKQRIGVVLDYAHSKGWRSTEAPMRSVNSLMRAIKQPKGGNFASMPYADVPAFMAKLRDGDSAVGKLALQFLILTAARSGEVRFATWQEFDLEKAEWRVPPERMKAGKLHIVPLVPAAVAIVKEMQGLFAGKPDDFVFPGLKGPMSDATMAKVLRVNGGGKFTVHGFRSSFRDWAADNGFADSWAEAALAHSNPNKTEAAYRRTTYFEQRKERLMPAWAAFVLNDKSNVVSLAEARA